MENTILDNELSGFTRKHQVDKRHFIVLCVLWLGLILTISNTRFFSGMFLLALGLILATTLLNFLKPKAGIYSTLILTILGMFGIITYSPFTLTFFIFKLSYGIELSHLFLCLLHLALFRREFFPSFYKEKRKPGQMIDSHLVEKFEKQYVNKTPKELIFISQDFRMTPEAIQAAKNILKKKETPEGITNRESL